jgi:tripartite-type tricarboxylate transporter receptor subunit TctC
VSQPFVLVVPPASKTATLADLLANLRAKPRGLTYSSTGVGGGAHFVTEKFLLAAGASAEHIPNKGAPEAALDVMAGRVDFLFAPISTALTAVRSGQLRAIAISSANRAASLPQVPTVAQAGLPGFQDSFWIGLWAPAGVPPALIDKISTDIQRAMTSPELKERFAGLGTEPMSMSQGEFARFVAAELRASATVVEKTGMKVN